MNRRITDQPHPWAPTPYCKIAVLVLGLLVLMTSYIFGSIAHAGTPAKAPVVTPTEDDGVMETVGWLSYERKDGTLILYCVKREGIEALSCVVWTGEHIVLVQGITPTEAKT